MTEHNLNQLTRRKLIDLAFNSAAILAEATLSPVKLGLYYFEGHFIEVSYRKQMPVNGTARWQICAVNHFPDIPENTHYLTIYLAQIELPIGEGKN